MGVLEFLASGGRKTTAPKPGIFDSITGEMQTGPSVVPGLGRSDLLSLGAGLLSSPTFAGGAAAGLRGVARNRRDRLRDDMLRQQIDMQERGHDFRREQFDANQQHRNRLFEANQDYRNQSLELQRQGLALRSQKADPGEVYATREAAAQQFGLQPGTPEHQSFVLTGQIPKPTGAVTAKPTVDSAKAAGFFDRMLASEQILSDSDIEQAAISRFNVHANRGIDPLGPFGPTLSLPREYQDENFLKFDQARRDFVNAVLRRESGAVISDAEFENANQQYFPQPGDPPALIDQKRRNRQVAIQGIRRAGLPSLNQQQQEPPNAGGEWQSLAGGIRIRKRGGNNTAPAEQLPASEGFTTHAKALPPPGGYSRFFKGAQ